MTPRSGGFIILALNHSHNHGGQRKKDFLMKDYGCKEGSEK